MASLLFEIPSGVLADVFGRKKCMILSQFMFILSALLMILSKGLLGICVSLVVSAFGYAFASGTREALAYDSLKCVGQEEQYLAYSSVEYSIYRIGSACATLCAGLALYLGYRRANFIDMVTGSICLLFCFRLKEVEAEQDQFGGTWKCRLLRCFRESVHFLTSNGRSLILMLFSAFCDSIPVLTAFFLQSRLTQNGLLSDLLGPGLFAITLGGAVGAKAVTMLQQCDYRKVAGMCMLGIVGGLAFSLHTKPLMMILGGFIGNFFGDLLQMKTDALLNERFSSAQRATLDSVSSLTFSFVMILMSPLMGWVLS